MKEPTSFAAKALVTGAGRGEALILTEPLSLWGGLDPATGEIVDRRHPASGANVRGKVLIMPSGRGSSSSSSILLEAVRTGVAPAAIILAESDPILALGAAVAREMYGSAPPVVVLERPAYDQIEAGQNVVVTVTGTVYLNATDFGD